MNKNKANNNKVNNIVEIKEKSKKNEDSFKYADAYIKNEVELGKDYQPNHAQNMNRNSEEIAVRADYSTECGKCNK